MVRSFATPAASSELKDSGFRLEFWVGIRDLGFGIGIQDWIGDWDSGLGVGMEFWQKKTVRLSFTSVTSAKYNGTLAV